MSPYDVLLADIREGVDLHYGPLGADPDLDLLLGDRAYADGLVRLAELGDLEATGILADAISGLAQAHVAGDARAAEDVWTGAAAAVRPRSGLV